MADKEVPTKKYWVYILISVIISITILLSIIVWEISYKPENILVQSKIDNQHTKWKDNTPINLIISYYQAAADNNSNLVQSAWINQTTRPARYAKQAMSSSRNNICSLKKSPIILTTNQDNSKAIVSVILECRGIKNLHQYSLYFHLIKNSNDLWKISDIADKQEKNLN